MSRNCTIVCNDSCNSNGSGNEFVASKCCHVQHILRMQKFDDNRMVSLLKVLSSIFGAADEFFNEEESGNMVPTVRRANLSAVFNHRDDMHANRSLSDAKVIGESGSCLHKGHSVRVMNNNEYSTPFPVHDVETIGNNETHCSSSHRMFDSNVSLQDIGCACVMVPDDRTKSSFNINDSNKRVCPDQQYEFCSDDHSLKSERIHKEMRGIGNRTNSMPKRTGVHSYGNRSSQQTNGNPREYTEVVSGRSSNGIRH